MKKPSSYNHNTLGSLVKPLISNLDFKRVRESLLKGEVEMYERFIWAEIDKRSEVKGGVQSNGKSATGNYATNKVAYREDGMRNMRTVWSINTSPTNDAHFATYPQNLVKRIINAGCPKEGIVLDPFIGAGTTAIIARKLSRKYIGFELNAKYIEIANKRIYNQLGLLNEIL